MQVRHLFGPQHAARAVQAFKSRRWSQVEFLELLESIDRHGAVSSLPAVSREALYAYLPSVVNPLVRHRCLNLLGAASDELKPYVGLSYLSSSDVEQAYVLARASPRDAGASGPYSALASQLINHGALQVRADSASTWAQLFEAGIRADDLAAARDIWRRRPAHIVPGEPTMLRFIELIGRHKDTGLLEEILLKTSGELPLTSSGIAASLACFSSDCRDLVRKIDRHETLIDKTLVVQDARSLSDALAPHVVEICESRDRVSTALGNILLQGLYRSNTSQTVFHVYRYLVEAQHFQPNHATSQILINSAYRLGNSKLLSYAIWRELSTDWRLQLDRKFYETAVLCQMVGSSYTSVLFFVAEMTRKDIVVRQHIQRAIYNKFERLGNTSPLLDMTFPGIRSKFREFDYEKAAAESVPAGQAENNAQLFIRGRNPEEEPLAALRNMLKFDQHRAKRS